MIIPVCLFPFAALREYLAHIENEKEEELKPNDSFIEDRKIRKKEFEQHLIQLTKRRNKFN